MIPRAEVLASGAVAIRATKALFVVDAAELVRLLIANPSAYMVAVQRGKAELRARATAIREARP